MPSGYTAAIKDGIDFKTFALSCARAFGALILMRDDPADAPIPDEVKPSPYNKNELAKAKKARKALLAMSQEEKEAAAIAYHADALQRWKERTAEAEELAAKYRAMLVQAEQWTPPTEDHVGMKEFMVKQITESLQWDCSITYFPKPLPVSAEHWYLESLKKADRDTEYHTKEWEAEVKRAADRTAWIKALKASLSDTQVPQP